MVGEKFAGADRHELNREFRELEQQTDLRKEGMSEILQASQLYLKTLGRCAVLVYMGQWQWR